MKPSKKLKADKKIQIREIMVLIFIFSIILANIQRVLPSLGREFLYIATRLIYYPNFSYEEKMKEKVGKEYFEWTKLVREHASIDSRLMHPPQMWPWGQSGNPEFSQYFLYPAKLIREDRRGLLERKDITHILIAWGEGQVEERLYGWPKFPVFSQKIYYLPQRRQIEVNGLDNLQEWIRDAQRTVNASDGKVFDLTYTSSQFDYWIKPVNLVLSPKTNLSVKVKSNWLNSTALIAKISYSKGRFAVFSSSPNQKIEEWEQLEIGDLYQRANRFAKFQDWPVSNLRVEGVGIDTGHPAQMPYLEKWGIIEVEKGGSKRLEFFSQQPVNSQTLLSLANIYSLEGKNSEAFRFYHKAAVLEPSNPWAHYGLAETLNRMGAKDEARLEYEKTISLAPEISWFYFALGEFYQKEGSLEKAISKYQESINLDPESSWAHLALGEIYEVQNSLDLAHQHYRLAGDPPRHVFLSDGKIAWQKAKKIKEEQNKIIEESLSRIEKDLEDWETRLALGNAYAILGEWDKAKEQYVVVYKISPEKSEIKTLVQIPPIIVDQLSQPIYGIKGRAVETRLMGTRPSVALDNYHSYVRYSKEFFPTENGTIEISWRPTDDSGRDQIPRNLIYQFKGLFVWIAKNKLNFAIFNRETERWEVISSIPFSWDGEKWYRIGVSYGKRGMYIFLDGKTIGQGPFTGEISEKNDIFLGRGPLWSVSDKTLFSGYFGEIQIYDYQKLKRE